MAATSRAQAGTRIRERRIDRGMRQAELAHCIGISPSYLNLIEHNRRRIAGRLLGDIARALDVEAGLLLEGADRQVLEDMQSAATTLGNSAELNRIEEFASRFPGWASLVSEQFRKISALEAKVQEVTDRVTHDPALATSLHSVISSVTSIRSTASILRNSENLDQDWLQRFHSNMYDDAVKLAANSETLVTYLETPDESEMGESPAQELEDWLIDHVDTVRDLEINAGQVEAHSQKAALSSTAKALLAQHLEQAMADAADMPLDTFSDVARQVNYDPAKLSQYFKSPLSAVFRRMSYLAPEQGHPPMGLAVCDASGAILFQKKVPEFSMSRSGASCPLWPIFTALGQPGRPVQSEVSLPGTPETRFQCYAIAEQESGSFGMPPIVTGTMLVVPDPPEGERPVLPIGPTCRICPRANCAARREPSALDAIL